MIRRIRQIMVIKVAFLLSLLVFVWHTDVSWAQTFQSEQCSEEELTARTQCMRRLPEKEYSYPLGYTALLPCEIANQHGKAQWSAREILLGHDRSIPGHDRYSMPGSAKSGDASLQIINLTISDSGDYECQVAPVPSGNHPLLRRKTYLEVTVMPSMPRLRSSNRNLEGRFIVSLPEQDKSIAVQCEALGGNPPPDFVWKLNDVTLESAKPPAALPEITTIEKSGFSNLTLLKSALKTGDRLACEVSNKATLARPDASARALRTTATVEIQYAPGAPHITFPGAHFDGNVSEGAKVTALCSAQPPGNPVGSLFWRWHFPPSPAPVAQRLPRLPFPLGPTPFDTNDFAQTIGHTEDVPTSFYAIYKQQDRLSSELVIPEIDRRYHSANLSCETAHATGVSMRTEQRIMVHFSPRNMTVQLIDNTLFSGMVAGRQEAIAYAKEGASLTFTCSTDDLFPDVTLKWVLLTEDRTVFRSDLEPSQSTLKRSTRKAGAFFRRSKITITMQKQYHRGFLDCQAWFDGTNRIMRSVRLGIMYVPDTPIIKGMGSREPLRERETRRLICESTRGHPPPGLQWVKGGKKITSTFQQQSFRDGVSLELDIVVAKEDNGLKLWCEAESKAQSTPIKSEALQLNVYYPPTNVVLRTNVTGAVLAGDAVEVSCEAGPSNPPAHLQWRYYHCSDVKLYMERAEHSTIQLIKASDSMLLNQARSTFEMDFKDCRTDERTGIVDPHENAANSGFISHGRLILEPKWIDHRDFVACLAVNSGYGPQTKEKKMLLNVSFGPNFVGYKPWASFSIFEGGSGTLDLIPHGNPPVTDITWIADGKPLKKSPVDLRKDDLTTPNVKRQLKSMKDGLYQLDELLIFWDVKRSHMKNVTIRAKNDIGTNSQTFFLNVTFSSKVKAVRDANVTLGSTAALNCTAEGNPAVAVRNFAWRRLIYPNWGTEAQEAPQIGTTSVVRKNDAIKLVVRCEDLGPFAIRSQLLIYNIEPEDVGQYECIVDNGIAPADNKQVQLLSSFAPTVVRQPKFEKVAAPFGSAVTLRCFINTEPLPGVDWFLTGRDGDGNSMVQYILDSRCDNFVPKPNSPCSVKPRAKPKFTQSVKRIRPGHHVASLLINNVHVTDFGIYMCRVSSPSGEATSLTIQVTGMGPPEIPYEPECLAFTSSSIKIGWGQGFNGGYVQTFRVRWRPVQSGEQYMYADIREEDHGAPMTYDIVGLKPSMKYEVSVNSRNEAHGSTNYTKSIFCMTNSTLDGQELFGGYYNVQTVGYSNSNSLFIIVSACVIGGAVIIINIAVIVYLMRKRRKQGSQFVTNQGFNLEKNPRSGLKPEIHHYRQPSHFYAPDPMMVSAPVVPTSMTEPVQMNPFYGYLPVDETGNQFAYVPGAELLTPTEPSYLMQPAVDGCLHKFSNRMPSGGRRTVASPAINPAATSTCYAHSPVAPKRQQPSIFMRSQSFGDILSDGAPQFSPQLWTRKQPTPSRSNTVLRQPSNRHQQHARARSIGTQRTVLRSPAPQIIGEGQTNSPRRVSFSDLAQRHHDYLGYTEDSYASQLEALQHGDSPTKHIMLNNNCEANRASRRRYNDATGKGTNDVMI